MNYEEFIEYVKENLGECYKEIMIAESSKDNVDSFDENKWNSLEVSTQKIVKNNGILLDAVAIYEDGERISPNIYLKPFYDNYIMGKPLDFIMTEIVFKYRNEKAEADFGYIDMDNYEKIKISVARIKEILEL